MTAADRTKSAETPYAFASTAQALAALAEYDATTAPGGLEGYDLRRDPTTGVTVWIRRNDWRSEWLSPKAGDANDGGAVPLIGVSDVGPGMTNAALADLLANFPLSPLSELHQAALNEAEQRLRELGDDEPEAIGYGVTISPDREA